MISAHRAPDAHGGGELRLSLSSPFESRGAEREEHEKGMAAIALLRDELDELERRALTARNEPGGAAEHVGEIEHRIVPALKAVEQIPQGDNGTDFDARLASLRKDLESMRERTRALGASCAKNWIALTTLPARVAAVQQAGKLDSETAAALDRALQQVSLLPSSDSVTERHRPCDRGSRGSILA